MSERYSRLFSLPENLYSVGAPVVIMAGALLKDNQTGKVLAQLKIQNISDKTFKAATVNILPLDTMGKPLGEAVSYQYLDLNTARDAVFGQKTPVAFPNAATRAFSVSVTEIIFTDNTVWTSSETVWEPLSAPVPLEQAFDDKELVTQYRIKYGENCKCIFNREKDLWRCACGVLNHENEQECHKCQNKIANFSSFDLENLKSEKNKRLELVRRNKKKRKRNILLSIPVVLVGIVIVAEAVSQISSVIRNSEVTQLLNLLEDGAYDEANTKINETEVVDYLEEHIEEYTKLSGDEIEELMPGTWQIFSPYGGYDSATFFEGGDLEYKSFYDYVSWEVDEDYLEISYGYDFFGDYKFYHDDGEIRKVTDNVYIQMLDDSIYTVQNILVRDSI